MDYVRFPSVVVTLERFSPGADIPRALVKNKFLALAHVDGTAAVIWAEAGGTAYELLPDFPVQLAQVSVHNVLV